MMASSPAAGGDGPLSATASGHEPSDGADKAEPLAGNAGSGRGRVGRRFDIPTIEEIESQAFEQHRQKDGEEAPESDDDEARVDELSGH